MSEPPVLWHIPISHYNEKVRWALDLKRIPHRRRVPPAGLHMAISFALTRGAAITFPVMQVDGRTLGDSTEIIAELERRRPEPTLYPADPRERERALALEDFFDEQLGAEMRHLVYHELFADPDAFEQVALKLTPLGPLEGVAGARRATASTARAVLRTRFGIGSEESAERARGKILAALDRLEAELDGEQYLVGGRFTVADLTAASLFYPLVLPPEGPHGVPSTPAFDRWREPLRDRPGYRYIADMFRRHRQGGQGQPEESLTSHQPASIPTSPSLGREA